MMGLVVITATPEAAMNQEVITIQDLHIIAINLHAEATTMQYDPAEILITANIMNMIIVSNAIENIEVIEIRVIMRPAAATQDLITIEDHNAHMAPKRRKNKRSTTQVSSAKCCATQRQRK